MQIRLSLTILATTTLLRCAAPEKPADLKTSPEELATLESNGSDFLATISNHSAAADLAEWERSLPNGTLPYVRQLYTLPILERVQGGPEFLVPRVFVPTLPHAYLALERNSHRMKSTFIALVLPHILFQNEKIAADRSRILELQRKFPDLTATEENYLRQISAIYLSSSGVRISVSLFVELLNRVDTIPVEIALAQAALESGWGWASYYLCEGNALFNVKAVHSHEARIGDTKRYQDIGDSVADYMHKLNVVNAYAKFRKARASGSNPEVMVTYLGAFAEKRDYTSALLTLIHENNLSALSGLQLSAAH